MIYSNDIEDLCQLFDEKTNFQRNNDGSKRVADQASSCGSFQHPLNVSTLAHYFGLQCDEFLRLSVNHPVEIKKPNSLSSSLMKTRGIEFENRLKSYFSTYILSDVHTEKDLVVYLRYAISNPDEFRIGYNVKFRWTYNEFLKSHYKPDFLLIRHNSKNENRLEITIADAKSSLQMSIDHCIQVTLYCIDLRIWIERNQLDQHVFINDFGEIWLPSEDSTIIYERKVFPMGKLRLRLQNFLKMDFEKIFQENTRMLLPRCSVCSYSTYCRQRVRDERHSINNLSYLSASSHLLLSSYFNSSNITDEHLQHVLDRFDYNQIDRDLSDRLKLEKILSVNKITRKSIALESLRTTEPQLKLIRNPYLAKPTPNLFLLFFCLIPNPSRLHAVGAFAYNIFDTEKKKWTNGSTCTKRYPSPHEIVSCVASAINEIHNIPKSTCQIILFDEQEQNLLIDQLILGSDDSKINQCLLILASTQNAILINEPPNLISNDHVFDSHSISHLRKDEIIKELKEKHNLDYDNDNGKTIKRDELLKILKENNDRRQKVARENLTGLPYLICLHSIIRQSFVVPVPGYFDLEDLRCAFHIETPAYHFDNVLNSIESENIDRMLQQRFEILANLYLIAQKKLSEADCLHYHAARLSKIQSMQTFHPHIRRLVFLRQYEMLTALKSMQQMRFENDTAPIIIQVQQHMPNDPYFSLWKCVIERGNEIITKNLTERSSSNENFRNFPYVIFKDFSSVQHFSDALYMDLVIDWMRSSEKFPGCGFLHIEEVQENSSIVICLKNCDFRLEVGQKYGLFERYIDFNTKKAIDGLKNVTKTAITILDYPGLLDEPQDIRKVPKEVQQAISNIFYKPESTIGSNILHSLNEAQQQACEKVKSQRVTLVWGPPGTGKTYWSSATILQILMYSKTPMLILITANTHAAIDNLLLCIDKMKKQFSQLSEHSRCYELAQSLKLLKLDGNKNNSKKIIWSKECSMVIGSTVWQLHKLDSAILFDVILIDEATQLLTCDSVLALNRLADHHESRLIVVGDPLQLAPIKRCNYPILCNTLPDLFSSLFHCLLRDSNNHRISLETEEPFEHIARCPYLAIFNENHRMNEELSDFTRLLYGIHYRTGHTKPVLPIEHVQSSSKLVLGTMLDSSFSIYTLMIESPSIENVITCQKDLELESSLIILLIKELVQRISPASIFIITPHRVQRSTIQRKLSLTSFPNVSITCDTVERMQGKEAECVLICMLYRQRMTLEDELEFIYNRQRINVSITRAQQLCILITSDILLNQPPFRLFLNESTRNGFNLLTNYVNKSQLKILNESGQSTNER